MKETSDQADVLLLDWAKRVGVNQESSEKLETQLKVLLIQQSREHGPDELVARTAKTLAVCLRSRGDWVQAEQYEMMAANLEGRRGGAGQGGDWRVHSKINQPKPGSSLWQERTEGVRVHRHFFGRSLKVLLKAFRS